MKFGLIKEAIDDKMVSLMKSGDSEGVKTLIKSIHENKQVSAQYKIYADVEKFETQSDFVAGEFIKEHVVDFAKLFGKDELTKANREIAEKLGLDLTKVTNKKMEVLDEFVFGNNKTKEQKYEALISQIKRHKYMSESFTKKFDVDYFDCNEKVQSIISENVDNNEELFKALKKSTLRYFNEQIENSKDLDEKSLFIDVKAKVVDMTEATDENISSLIKLQND